MTTARHYAEIEDQLLQLIKQSAWKPGAYLPSQSELARKFDVSRHVIRVAQAKLVERGLLVIAQGARAQVRSPSIDFPITRQTRFTPAIQRMGMIGTAELLSFRRRRPPAEIARSLGLSRPIPVQTVSLLRRIDGQPFSLAQHYLSPRFNSISAPPVEDVSISSILRDHGFADFRRQCTTVTTRLATASEAAALGIRPRGPVLSTIGCNVAQDGTPLEISNSVFPGHFVRFLIEH